MLKTNSDSSSCLLSSSQCQYSLTSSFVPLEKNWKRPYDGFPLSVVSSSAFRIAELICNHLRFLTGLADGELVGVHSDADHLVDGPLSGGSSDVVCGGVDGDNLLPTTTPSLSVSSSKVSSLFASDTTSTSEVSSTWFIGDRKVNEYPSLIVSKA